MSTARPPITELLRGAARGEAGALDAVFEALYPDLKRIARARLHAQGRAGGMGTTTLVHESFLRLANAGSLRLEDRRHFFAYAAKTMRHVIVDVARASQAERRGGGADHVALDDHAAAGLIAPELSAEAVSVHEALGALEALEPELSELVEMRYFGGYLDSEIAALLGVNERTVRRRWDKARSFLYLALRQDVLPGEAPLD